MTRKYLIIGPAWVGDMVMAQSLFKFLCIQNPSCTIDVAAPKSCLALLEFMPEVNLAIELPFKHGEFGFAKRKQFGKKLIKNKYTHSIVLPNSWKSALVPFFAKIPTRIGWKGESRYVLLNDLRKLDKNKYPLMIERFCALAIAKGEGLLENLPHPSFSVTKSSQNAAIKKFKLDLTKPVLALCPGAEYGPAKRWPASHYATVANSMLQDNMQVWLMGSPGDVVVTDEINLHTENKCINFAGKTSLSDAVVLLSLARKVVSNDSGLMHISSALNIKTVVVYGSSSDKFTPPLSENSTSIHIDIECRPCFKRTCPLKHLKCLNDLEPQLVLDKLRD
jgi:heptosyltransferase-2